MSKKTRKQGKVQDLQAVRAQARIQTLIPLFQQLMLPMVTGLELTKQNLQNLVLEFGLAVTRAYFGAQAEALVGPKHKHQPVRTMNHWGSKTTEFPFAGRKVGLERPRVRSVDGEEVPVPGIEELRERDPLPEYVVEQILLGISTRGFSASLDPTPSSLDDYGTSRSAASRHIVKETTRRMEDFCSRKLAELDLPVLMMDGIEVAKRSVIVALGIDAGGEKHPLGLVIGSTENKAACISLLQNLLERGLHVEGKLLCAIDGGKGLRAAIEDVFGDAAVVQRCQNHKRRNVHDHLPQHRRPYAMRVLNEAYKAKSYATAKKKLQQLVSWLDNNGEEEAAASVREGMDETLTVLKLNLPEALVRSLATTNAIENLMGTIRRVTRNIKRWRNENKMVKRWTSLAIGTAQSKFRRIKGYRFMPQLTAILRKEKQMDIRSAAA